MSKKSKDNYRSAIEEYYVRNDSAYISCNIQDYADLIDFYSPADHAWPKREFLQYVEDNAANIPSRYPIVLELKGAHFSGKQKMVIEQALTNYFRFKLGESSQKVSGSRKKAISLFLFSIVTAALLAGYWMFSGNCSILEETLMVAFWFFLWECGDVVVFERRSVRKRREASAQLASIRIVFNECSVTSGEWEHRRKVISLQEARRHQAHA